MIKNVIFDIGNVLAHFRWEDVFRETLGLCGQDFSEVADATVRAGVWNEFDRSLMTDEEIVNICVSRAPQHEEVIRRFFRECTGDLIRDFDYSYGWLKGLKDRGYKVYILSNYGNTSFNACIREGHLRFLELVDGRVISYEVQKVKPEPEIYEEILSKYALDPAECVFIDDRPENIEGAEKAGIRGIVFTDFKKAEAELEKMLNFTE